MASSILRVDWAICVGHNHDVVLLCPSLNSQGAGVSSSLAQRVRLLAVTLVVRVVELKQQVRLHLPACTPDQAIFAQVLGRLPRLIY